MMRFYDVEDCLPSLKKGSTPPYRGTILFLLSHFLTQFPKILSHENQSHINSNFPPYSTVTRSVAQTNLYLAKD